MNVRAIIFGALALIGCASPEPVTRLAIQLDPAGLSETEQSAMIEALEDAAERIEWASGIEVAIEDGGLPIRVQDEVICGGVHAAGCNRKKDGKHTEITIRRAEIEGRTLEETIIHELFHRLGHKEHNEEGGIMDPMAFKYVPKIRTLELETLCSESVCSAFRPERP
jgi:hypothetical protein